MSLEKKKNQEKEKLFKNSCSLKNKGFSQELLTWYQISKEDHPWRAFWQKHKSPYHVWVSEIMLQQTLIKVVVPLYIKFIKKFPNLRSLAQAETRDLQQAVKGLGYYNRFDRLHKAAKYLCEQGSRVVWPSTHAAWKKIPGVGEYTASALSSICFDEKKAVVDGNVERVLSRLFLITDTINSYSMKKTLQELSQNLITEEEPGDYNQGIMELGQKVCLKSKPLCGSCPVSVHCVAFKKKLTHTVPVVVKAKKSVEVHLKALVTVRKNKIFLANRENGSRFLKNRMGFPLEELKKTEKKSEKLIGSFSHSITHHKIRVDIVKSSVSSLKKQQGLWVEAKDLESCLISSLDGKILKFMRRDESSPF